MINVLRFFCFFIINICLSISCNNRSRQNENYSDTLYILHAGSFSVPLQWIKDSFQNHYPYIKICAEACGSKQCIRNIIDLQRKCDVFISADKKLIDSMLVPHYADSSYFLMSNEMVIAYNNQSKYAQNITKKNWYQILSKDDVCLTFSDPSSDPCGARVLSVITLSIDYYKEPMLYKKILGKDNIIIRSKEVDVLTLLDLNEADYTIIYKSVAIQHQLNYISLPDSINLSNFKLADWYKQHFIQYKQSDGTIKRERIEPIEYGYTNLKTSKHSESVKKFLRFMRSTPVKSILEKTGHKL
ncbi:MAG: substrate-binding domain-containing protein [Bacteroidales bacterium]|nr:substrate-binding domain-containing protein [Bacteroidales bacterium]